jgi:DNA-binding MarR family transcriptional regulator
MSVQIRPLGKAMASLKGVLPAAFKAKIVSFNLHLSFEQFIILKIALQHKGMVVQQDVASMMGKDKSVVMRIVDCLEKDGLIKRVVDANDRRRNMLEVTTAGLEMISRFDEVEMALSEEIMEGLTEQEIETFYKVIDRIVQNGEKMI